MNQKSINFVQYCNTGNVDAVIESLKDETVDVNLFDGAGLRLASQKGYIEIVKLLLEDKRTDVSAKENYALKWSMFNEQIETTNLILDDCRILDCRKSYFEFLQLSEDRADRIAEDEYEESCGLTTVYLLAILLMLV